MPIVRDGNNRVIEYETAPPPANPSGPVERLVEPSMVRVPDATPDYMAASRARGAKAAGFVKGATKTARRWNGQPPAAPATSEPVAKKRLGPAPGFKRSPETRERMRLGQLARYERIRSGLGADGALAPEAGGGPGVVDATFDTPDQEEAAPAVAIASPPGPPEAPVASLPAEGEDRCPYAAWLGTTHLTVCDRPEAHGGGHRGRTFRVGVTAGTCELLGHLAVPA